MKKRTAFGLSIVLVLGLVACGPQAQEPQEPGQEVQQTAPVTPSETPTPTQPVEETAKADTLAAPVEESHSVEDGDGATEGAGSSEGGEPSEGDEQEVVLFTDCNETVYAIGTVNIRESWTTDSKKLGSLAKGKSITRTGTSIKDTEADGWSRVKLSDGTVAFISTKYLTTTKPVTQQPSGGSGKTQAKTPSSGSQKQQPTGQSQEDKNKAADQGLALMDEWAAQHPGDPNADPASRPGTVVDENGNRSNPDVAVNMG